jgi:cation diffusion facilitator family transporter
MTWLGRYRLLLSSDLASRAASLALLSNVCLLALKLAVGLITGSIAVLSDGLDSAEDAIASTFALWSVRMSAKPADEEHPYGHGKAEGIAAAGQALLIISGAGFIIFQAVRRLIVGQAEIGVGLGLGAMGVTALVNLGVLLYVARAAKQTESVALMAATRHLWTNIAQAAAVIIALVLVGATGRREFDPIVALLLAGYLIFAAWGIILGAAQQIMDVRLPPDEEEIIQESILRYRGEVSGFHELRTRRSGRQRYVELHLTVDPKRSVEDVHAVCDRIEQDIETRLPGAEVTIHVEPDDNHPH